MFIWNDLAAQGGKSVAYEALARKWRPKTFDDIVGQSHVSRALSNAISSGKVHHAYLFSGTRGVGKTTFARILARALNCESGPTSTPCLSCPACEETGSGGSADVQEIDGASNNGIDDIRRLREGVAYAPSRLRYKVYIIDEVHMLSTAAFNGLLKTLEEPPPHVIFILATTEPNKIPDTILSRCQRFDFRMLTDAEIRGRLAEMAAAEGVAAEEDALTLMARYAFGSMRDGQSLFEQATVSGAGNITAPLIEGMLGLVGIEAAIDLTLAAVLEGVGQALVRFHALRSGGADLKHLYRSLIDVLRDAAVLSFTGNTELLYGYSPGSLERMKEAVSRRAKEEWMFFLDIAFRSERDVLGTEFPHFGFELLLLRLANAQGLLAVGALEAGASDSPAPPPPQVLPKPVVSSRKPATAQAASGDGAITTTAGKESPLSNDVWNNVKRIIEGKRKVVLTGLLPHLSGEMREDEFVVYCGNEVFIERLKEPDKWSIVLSAVEEALNRPVPVRLEMSAEKKSPEHDVGVKREEILERQILSDPVVLEALRVFNGAMLAKIIPLSAATPVAEVPDVPAAGDEESEKALFTEALPEEE
ncbi:MAG: DNA polymerase III subunit gamma/tau [Syntrophorhabdaceae bacterium]|nr:DNA polymerase III subunit gamma/tau [Syntrophorhabdaceae bacterium]